MVRERVCGMTESETRRDRSVSTTSVHNARMGNFHEVSSSRELHWSEIVPHTTVIVYMYMFISSLGVGLWLGVG